MIHILKEGTTYVKQKAAKNIIKTISLKSEEIYRHGILCLRKKLIQKITEVCGLKDEVFGFFLTGKNQGI